MKTVIGLLSIAVLIFIADVSFGEENPVVTAVSPIYPDVAYRARYAGTRKVEVEVNNYGEVTNAHALGMRCPPLDDPSEKAARKWKFTTKAGELSIRKYVITFTFKMMPYNTKEDELINIYNAPFEMEVRIKQGEDQMLILDAR